MDSFIYIVGVITLIMVAVGIMMPEDHAQ